MPSVPTEAHIFSWFGSVNFIGHFDLRYCRLSSTGGSRIAHADTDVNQCAAVDTATCITDQHSCWQKRFNPLRLIVHPVAKLESNSTTVADLEAAIEKKTGLVVKIEVVESDAAGLAALCASTTSRPALAWLSGLGYITAQCPEVWSTAVAR